MPRDILRDLTMVHHPIWWPIDGALPLTHLTEMEPEPNPMGLHKLGFILESTPLTVHVGCLHMVALGITRLEDLAERNYETTVKMLQEWTVG
jgi:hypothetical protein